MVQNLKKKKRKIRDCKLKITKKEKGTHTWGPAYGIIIEMFRYRYSLVHESSPLIFSMSWLHNLLLPTSIFIIYMPMVTGQSLSYICSYHMKEKLQIEKWTEINILEQWILHPEVSGCLPPWWSQTHYPVGWHLLKL